MSFLFKFIIIITYAQSLALKKETYSVRTGIFDSNLARSNIPQTFLANEVKHIFMAVGRSTRTSDIFNETLVRREMCHATQSCKKIFCILHCNLAIYHTCSAQRLTWALTSLKLFPPGTLTMLAALLATETMASLPAEGTRIRAWPCRRGASTGSL